VRITSFNADKKTPTPTLPFGKKVGHIKVGPNRSIGKDQKYFATCDCGRSDWYTAGELWGMLDNYGGCGMDDCTALSFRDTVWYSDESLKMQLYTVLLLRPEDVQSVWGGTMDDLYEVGLKQALTNLQDYFTEEHCSGVWLSRKDEGLPFMEGNLRLSTKPDAVFRQFAKASVLVEGEPMTMKELCCISGLNASELLLRLYKLGTTDDLLLNLMEDI